MYIRVPVLSLALIFLFSISLVAQAPPKPVIPDDHSGEAAIYQQISTRVSFENDGTSTRESTVRVLVQSEAGVQTFGVIRFPYASAVETPEIVYLRVRKPDGTMVVTPPENFQDMPAEITQQAPFYSDLREKHAAVKGLSTGDIIEYQYRSGVEKPLVPGQFWFDWSFVHDSIALTEHLEIRVPRERAIKLKSALKPTTSDDGKYRVYIWTTTNLKGKKEETAEKQALQQITGRHPLPDVMLSSFQGWEEVGRWYWDLQLPRVKTTPEIDAKAALLTKDAANNPAKLHAIYKYVSTQFRYIGVAFGVGRYQPHSAGDVLSNQYGDCKDKHTLLVSLLESAGIKGYPALISGSHEIDPNVPSPSQFDHVITVILQDKEPIWLDTTTEVGPFAYLAAPLRGKHALLITAETARLVPTPADIPFKMSQTFKAKGKLSSEGTLYAKIEHTDRGDAEVLYRMAFRRTSQAQWKDLAQQVSYASGFGGEVSDVSASPPENTDEPFHLAYSYTRKKYGGWDDQRVTAPLPFIVLPGLNNEEKTPEAPFWLGSPGEILFQGKMELPKGYSLDPSPAVNLVYEPGA